MIAIRSFFSELRAKSLQARDSVQSLSPRGTALFAFALIPLALVVGALMSGEILHGRSSLFVITLCLSLPALFLAGDREKKRFIAVALFAALLIAGVFSKPYVMGDAPANTRTAFNILTYSVYTPHEYSSSPVYSSYREPLFPFTMLPFAAAALHDLRDISDPAQRLEALYTHPYLKGATCLWTALLLLGIWKMGTFRNGHFIAVWLSLSFAFTYFCRENIGNMLTEIPAAALLVWLAWAYMKALDSGKARWLVLAGVVAAGTAMTKMLFLYVFLGSSPLLALALYWRGGQSFGQAARAFFLPAAALGGAFGLYVALMMAMHPGICAKDVFSGTRGDGVLAIRALKNTMTPDERWGSLYAYSKGGLNSFFGFIYGATEKDVQRGGRWERLSRGTDRAPDGSAEKWLPMEERRSYYGLARGMEGKNLAKDMILQNLPLHLAMTPIFLYRGLFGLATGSTGLALFAYCSVAFVRSLTRKRPLDLVTLWFPLAMIGAYALSSHFIPRYAEPMGPLLQTFFCVHLAMWLAARGQRDKPHSTAP